MAENNQCDERRRCGKRMNLIGDGKCPLCSSKSRATRVSTAFSPRRTGRTDSTRRRATTLRGCFRLLFLLASFSCRSTDVPACAGFLVDMQQKRGLASELQLFACQLVMQMLVMRRVATAKEVSERRAFKSSWRSSLLFFRSSTVTAHSTRVSRRSRHWRRACSRCSTTHSSSSS